MFQEIKKVITEAEGSRKLSSILIYQDNIEEVSEDIDSMILQIRSLMETNSIQEMIDNKVINPNNFDFAKDNYEIVYKKMFEVKSNLDEVKENLSDLLKELNKKEPTAPLEVRDDVGDRKEKVVHSESFDRIADYAYIKEGVLQLNELFGKVKSPIPVWSIIDKILNLSVPQIKEILKKIDFTKQYTDADIDKILLGLKDELADLKKAADPRSLDDVLFFKNLRSSIEKGATKRDLQKLQIPVV